jgi:hypothetical protein
MQEYKLAAGVVMQKRILANRWQRESWQAVAIVPDPSGEAPELRQLLEGPDVEQWLHTGFIIELFRDEAENYYLNVSAGEPCVFVMWRNDDTENGMAMPKAVTMSYGEAARMMDAGEQVDNVPMPADLREWVEGFVRQHYRPEPKKRVRPPSFKGARRGSE